MNAKERLQALIVGSLASMGLSSLAFSPYRSYNRRRIFTDTLGTEERTQKTLSHYPVLKKLLDLGNARRESAGFKPVKLKAEESPVGPYYEPGFVTNEPLIVSDLSVSPGIMAHELGHAVTAPFWEKKLLGLTPLHLRSLFPLSLPLGVAPYLAKTPARGRMYALLGTLSTVPTLANEIHASLAGMRLAREAGLPLSDQLGALVGLPTYFAGAAVPWLSYFLTRKFVR